MDRTASVLTTRKTLPPSSERSSPAVVPAKTTPARFGSSDTNYVRNAPFGVGSCFQCAALSALAYKPAAGAGIDRSRPPRVHLNAEHVGVVNHAGVNRFPRRAAVSWFATADALYRHTRSRGSAGSKASETTGRNSALSGAEMCFHDAPPSMLRYTPSSVPAAITSGFAGNSASDQTALPLLPASSVQVLPPFVVLYNARGPRMVAFHTGVPGAGRPRIDFERVQGAVNCPSNGILVQEAPPFDESKQQAIVRARDDQVRASSAPRAPVPHRRRKVRWYAIRPHSGSEQQKERARSAAASQQSSSSAFERATH